MMISIDGRKFRAENSGLPCGGWQRVMMFDRGLPVAEHVLPENWKDHLPFTTSGHTYKEASR